MLFITLSLGFSGNFTNANFYFTKKALLTHEVIFSISDFELDFMKSFKCIILPYSWFKLVGTANHYAKASINATNDQSLKTFQKSTSNLSKSSLRKLKVHNTDATLPHIIKCPNSNEIQISLLSPMHAEAISLPIKHHLSSNSLSLYDSKSHLYFAFTSKLKT
jgi:hypothetical protein